MWNHLYGKEPISVFLHKWAWELELILTKLLYQCWKFLSPGRPRWSGLDLGNLFSDLVSLGWRPEMTIFQLLWGLQTSMTTQFAVQRVVWAHSKHNILMFLINHPIEFSFCVHQGYLSLLKATWFSIQVARRMTTEFPMLSYHQCWYWIWIDRAEPEPFSGLSEYSAL